jgi:hypothetical protein
VALDARLGCAAREVAEAAVLVIRRVIDALAVAGIAFDFAEADAAAADLDVVGADVAARSAVVIVVSCVDALASAHLEFAHRRGG